MRTLSTLTGVFFFITAGFEGVFFGFSCLGVGTGGLMVSGIIPQETPDDEILAFLVVGFYGMALFVTGFATVCHVVGGAYFIQGRGPSWLGWATSVGGLASVLTVYCGLFSVPCFVLGILCMAKKMSQTEPEPGRVMMGVNPVESRALGDPFAPPDEG